MGEDGATGAAGDPDRTLALLWRHVLGTPQGARGPRQRLTVDAVVAAGVEVADADGLAAFSMRRVAEHLGVGVMSLYTYVPGRDELVALMHDDVLGRTPLPGHPPPVRARMRAVADRHRDLALGHPWVLDVDATRPWAGPHSVALYEWQLAALEGVGLSDVEMDQAVVLLVGTAASAARAQVDADRTRRESGVSDLAWWQANAPVLERVMPAGAFPLATRVGRATGEEYGSAVDPGRAWAFAAERVLDGLEALLAERT